MVEEKKITIYVKVMGGETYLISATGKEKVPEFKTLIQQQEGIPVDKQKLIFGGTEMLNKKTIPFYKIANESTIHMVVKP